MIMTPKFRAAILLNAVGASSATYKRLCEKFDPDDLINDEKVWDAIGLSRGAKERLNEFKNSGSSGLQDWADREIDRAKKCGARFISIDDTDYPSRLLDIDRPPLGIYVRGNVELALPSIAVVGTRKCSAYGKSVAEAIGRALARVKMTVISGGARGIDAASHRGALEAGGVTIAVMGTGIDKVYPSEHRELFNRIVENGGALISEYPMGANGENWHFPERNKIIVAMSGRTVVIESPADGGAMISARLALALGREVWAVPGQINETVCEGSNNLLSEGATPLVNIQNFIEQVSGKYGQLALDLDFSNSIIRETNTSGTDASESANLIPDTGFSSSESRASLTPLSSDEKTVLSILQRQGNRTVDDIIAESGIDFITVQTCVVTLEASGLIVTSGPGRYSASA